MEEDPVLSRVQEILKNLSSSIEKNVENEGGSSSSVGYDSEMLDQLVELVENRIEESPSVKHERASKL